MPSKRQKDDPPNGLSGEHGHDDSRGMEGPTTGTRGMRGNAMRPQAGSPGMAGSSGRTGGSMEAAGRSGEPHDAMGEYAGGGAGTREVGQAPSEPRRRRCATMDVHRRLLNESAEYRAARAAIETAALERAGAPSRFAGVVTIPVVVHVVHHTVAQKVLIRRMRDYIRTCR